MLDPELFWVNARLTSNTAERPFLKFPVVRDNGYTFARGSLSGEHYMRATLTANTKAMTLQNFYGLFTADWHIAIG
jgi:hypothetical protein